MTNGAREACTTRPSRTSTGSSTLFLDGLKAELEGAEARPVAGGSRTNALNKLHDKIADLRFLDPACGSGNFLTETYLELRRIENRILADLDKDGQLALDLGDDINRSKSASATSMASKSTDSHAP